MFAAPDYTPDEGCCEACNAPRAGAPDFCTTCPIYMDGKCKRVVLTIPLARSGQAAEVLADGCIMAPRDGLQQYCGCVAYRCGPDGSGWSADVYGYSGDAFYATRNEAIASVATMFVGPSN